MAYVYRYRDLTDGIIKYIGIIAKESNFPRRFAQHQYDKAFKGKHWEISYIKVLSKCDAEALEGHFINKYHTYNWLNKAKSDWGQLTFAEEANFDWIPFNQNELYGEKSLMECALAFSTHQSRILDTIDKFAPGYAEVFNEFWSAMMDLIDSPEGQAYIKRKQERAMVQRALHF